MRRKSEVLREKINLAHPDSTAFRQARHQALTSLTCAQKTRLAIVTCG